MKIALLHLNLSTESGDPRMFLSIALGLKRLGHQVVVYTAEFDKEKCFPDLNRTLDIRVVPPRAPLASVVGGAAGVIERIVERVRRNRLFGDAARRIGAELPGDLDILVCQNDQSYFLGRMYKRVHPGTRVVWIMNNAPFYSVPKGSALLTAGSFALALWEKLKVSYYLRGIDTVVVHDRERKKMIDAFGVSSMLIRIPVDFKSFYEPVKTRKNTKRVTLLSVGALSPIRKFEDTIRAGAELRRSGYDTRVMLVCKDFWSDQGYREMLLRTAEEAGMAAFVKFHFEGVSEEALRAIQRESDVFIFPQHVNIWSMAAFEAMAAGLPLVVSRATSVAEALRDGENALFVDPGAPEQIAERVDRLMRDRRLRKSVARAGQRFVEEHLSWERYADSFLRAARGASVETS